MFDWRFYQNEELIEEYLSLKSIDNIYKVNDNLHYNYINKILTKNTDEHCIIVDIQNGKINIKLNEFNYVGDMDLYKSNVDDSNNEITITYQISKEEPVNKIVISRRNL